MRWKTRIGKFFLTNRLRPLACPCSRDLYFRHAPCTSIRSPTNRGYVAFRHLRRDRWRRSQAFSEICFEYNWKINLFILGSKLSLLSDALFMQNLASWSWQTSEKMNWAKSLCQSDLSESHRLWPIANQAELNWVTSTKSWAELRALPKKLSWVEWLSKTKSLISWAELSNF